MEDQSLLSRGASRDKGMISSGQGGVMRRRRKSRVGERMKEQKKAPVMEDMRRRRYL